MKAKLFGLFLFSTALAITLSGCKEEIIPVEQEEKDLFQKVITISDTKNQNVVALKLQANAPELLDQISPEQFSLKVFYEKPSATEALITNAPTIAPEISAASFNENNSIMIEMEVLKQEKDDIGLALEVKQRQDVNRSVESRSQSQHQDFFLYTRDWAHRVKVTNYSSNSVVANFYYHNGNRDWCYRTSLGCLDQHAKSVRLYRDGRWYYYNCNRQVGVTVNTFGNYYNFLVEYWSECQP